MKSWFKRMFVPHEGNNHHPHFWKDNSIAVLLALILLSELAVFAQTYIVFNKDSYLAAILPAVLTSLTNDQRTFNNEARLSENHLLVQAAEAKAADMAAKGYFAHNTPEGYLPWYWLDKVGYKYTHAGENLAVNFTDSKDVVDAWMKSPTHRANIVKDQYTEIGIGMAEGEYEGKHAIFVAQFFGTPAKISEEPVVAPVVAVAAPTVAPTVIPAVKLATPIKNPAPAKPVTLAKATSTNATVATSTTTSTASTTVLGAVSPTSTASSNMPAVEGAQLDAAVSSPNFIQTLLASPRHVETAVLYIILGVIIAAFLLMLLVNGKVHHPRITLMMVALIVIVVGIMVLNTRLLRDNVIVGENAIELSASSV